MFTNNWFQTTAKANFEKYLLPLKDKPVSFLEIGCYEGQSSLWMLENVLTHKNSGLTVIDTFEGSPEHGEENDLLERFKENIKGYSPRILKGNSRFFLKNLAINQFDDIEYDFIYVDGSHEATDVLEDAVLSFPLLKTGGLMIFDDYQFGSQLDKHLTPKPAIDAFLEVYANKIKVLDINGQVILQKC